MSVQPLVQGFLLVGLSLTTSTKGLATERPDLQQAWQTLLCAESFPKRPTSLWKAGVFDAQVEGRLYESSPGTKIESKDIARKARSMAKALRHQGHAFGTCDNGNAWSLSTPANKPLVSRKGSYELPIAALEAACLHWTVAFAPSLEGQARSLPAHKTVRTKDLGDGVLSVECTPKKPRWLGKQVWYLAPVGNGPAMNVPHVQVLAHADAATGLINWINALRKDVGFGPVFAKAQLSKAASVLAISRQINHDRSLLKQMSLKLEAEKISLLGEDRVSAANLQEAAWLLWNSPSHRSLLLHPEAAFVGTALLTQGPELFAVITVGRPELLNTAKASSSKPIKTN